MKLVSSAIKRSHAIEIVRTLQTAGFQAFFAGGCVRDQLLGIDPKDFDVATSAPPAEVIRLFPGSQKVGAAFGVILVGRNPSPTEVATFRTDGVYLDGRRPKTVTFSTAEADAHRRDFTINGMFYDPLADRIIDYVDGQADIGRGLIRAIGDASARFMEDHLRMLRAIRFAARYNFNIEDSTWNAICRQHEKLKLISRERIGMEFRMLLENPNRNSAVEWLLKSRLMHVIWPRPLAEMGPLDGGPQSGDDGRGCWLERLRGVCPYEAALAALIHDLSPAPHDSAFWINLQSALMLSNQGVHCVRWITEQFQQLENWRALRISQIKRMMADGRFDCLRSLFFAVHAESENPELVALLGQLWSEGVAPVPLISGVDLISLGAAPGPDFRRWLEMLYDMQLENRLTEKSGAIEAARKLIASESG